MHDLFLIHIPQTLLAAMFAMTLPYAFDVTLARSVGLGGLRAEVGAKSGRPFHVTRFDPFRHEPPAGGQMEVSELGEYIARCGAAGEPLSIGMLVFLKAMHDTAEEKQRDVFRDFRRKRSDRRNRQQADILRAWKERRDTARSAAAREA